MKNALIILAGGKGNRFSQKTPKQFYNSKNGNFLNTFLNNLDTKHIDIMIICIENKFINKYLDSDILKKKIKILFSKPGKTRQESSYNSLKKIEKFKINNVLIHDAARPICSNKLINKIYFSLKKKDNAIPYIESSDRQITIKNHIEKKVINIQTPQGFNYNLIYKLHNKYKKYNFKDDASLLQKFGHKINLIKGENTNIKITYQEDLVFLKHFKKIIFKSGIGYDIHRFDNNTKKGLKLCGVRIPFSKLIGHSDADVGYHAICDSIFGALSMRDIGYYFPNTNKVWKNKPSSTFVTFCKKKLDEKGYHIVNLDINFITEKPKISKYVNKMKKNISKILKIPSKIISIKATTNEKISFIGKGEGIAAESIIQITNEKIN